MVQTTRVARACLSTLVTASCRIRYADRSTPGGSGRGVPSTRSSAVSPPARTGSSSSAARVRPGWGMLVAGSSGARSTPSSRCISSSAWRPVRSATQQRLLLRLLLGPQQSTHAADVQHRDAQAVRHDIVQLARDPAPLLGHRGRRLPLGLPLELGGPLLQQLGASLPDAHRVTGQPHAADDQAREQQVTRRRAVLDQDRRPDQGQCRKQSQDGAPRVIRRGRNRHHHRPAVGVKKVFESTPSTAWAIPAANTTTSTVSGARRRHTNASPITSPVTATAARGPPTTTPDHTSTWARPATPNASSRSRRAGRAGKPCHGVTVTPKARHRSHSSE